mmetsp:Transcript_36214/g.106946  ORF Transcript_36214/g.106946 Transcript_36214/m.106946 type:complete len:247 (-) Transcript_36214:57-797(-)
MVVLTAEANRDAFKESKLAVAFQDLSSSRQRLARRVQAGRRLIHLCDRRQRGEASVEGLELWVRLERVSRHTIQEARRQHAERTKKREVGIRERRADAEVATRPAQQLDEAIEPGLERASGHVLASRELLLRSHLCGGAEQHRVEHVLHKANSFLNLGSLPVVRRVHANLLGNVALHRSRLRQHLAVHLEHRHLTKSCLSHLGLPLLAPLLKRKLLFCELDAAIVEQHAHDLTPARQGEVVELVAG